VKRGDSAPINNKAGIEEKMSEKRIALFFLLFSLSLAAFGRAVDLGSLDFFVRAGFDPAWTAGAPASGDPNWIRVPARPGDRPIVIRDLALPGRPAGPRLQVVKGRPESFTLLAAFAADPALLASPGGIGLFLARIGLGWEVYVNGSLVRSEVRLDRNGSISTERAVRGALVALDARILKPGPNLLCIRVIGDPSDARTGLAAGGPYLIDSYVSLLGRKTEYLDLVLVGIYAFLAFYHLLLYAMRPKDKSYLLYGLATLLVSAFLFFRGYLVFDLFRDTATIDGFERIFLFLLLPSFMAFYDHLVRGKSGGFTIWYGAACLAAGLASPFALREPLLRIWQYTIPAPLLYLIVADLALPLSRAWRSARGDMPFGTGVKGFEAARIALVETDLGKLLLGTLVLVATLAWDMAALAAGGELGLSRLGFFVMVAGGAAILAAQFSRVYATAEGTAASLEAKVRERTVDLQDAIDRQTALNAQLISSGLRLQNTIDLGAKDMRIAVRVQELMFPQAAPEPEGWELAFDFIPAMGVSADFVDFYLAGNRLEGLVVGDVSGHGVASGLISIMARSLFEREFRGMPTASLGRILEAVNGELIAELSTVENYLTCILLRFREGSVEYANAAHCELAYRVAGKAKANLLLPRHHDIYKGPPLGREGIEVPYSAVKFGLSPGDCLLVYSDGLTGARDEQGRSFGVEGLLTAFGRAPEGPARDMLDYIMDDLRFHAGTLQLADDLTVVLVKRRE
jgi:sigma-B regulation protein RsbU (phosphoserine phosphatase)